MPGGRAEMHSLRRAARVGSADTAECSGYMVMCAKLQIFQLDVEEGCSTAEYDERQRLQDYAVLAVVKPYDHTL